MQAVKMNLSLGWLFCILLGTASSQEWRLVWEDNFDFLDMRKWDHEVTAWGGGNNEFQVYIPDRKNTYTQNGMLHITPTLLKNNINPKTGRPFGEQFLWSGTMDLWSLYGRCTNSNNWGCFRDKGNIPPIASGRIRSKDRFSFKYGKVEFRARMPGGDWHWPAIWLLPEQNVYGEWPMSGEIDIVEIVGNRKFRYGNGAPAGAQRAGSALHWGIDPTQNKYSKTNRHTINETLSYADGFHDYKMIWSNIGFSFYLDGRLYYRFPNPLINRNPNWKGFYEFGKPWKGSHNPWSGGGKMTPFDQNFHILLNVAVGGTNGFIPDGVINHGGKFPKPWRNSMPWRQAKDSFYAKQKDWLWTWNEPFSSMQVDYIKVYQR